MSQYDTENPQGNPPSENDESEGIPVFIIGDVAIDWLAANRQSKRRESEDRSRNNQPQVQDRSWRDQPQVRMLAMMSGAWLLENFMLRLGPRSSNRHTYWCYKRPKSGETQEKIGDFDLKYSEVRRTANPSEYLHTFTELNRYDRGPCDTVCSTSNGKKVYRIGSVTPRYYGPGGKDPSNQPDKNWLESRRAESKEVTPPNEEKLEKNRQETPEENQKKEVEKIWQENLKRIQQTELEVTWKEALEKFGQEALEKFAQEDREKVRQESIEKMREGELNKPRLLVVFDGDYDGFRSNRKRWENLIPGEEDPNLYIILFQKPPFPCDPRYQDKSALWERISKYHADRTVLIVSSDSLRRSGVNINKSLSWERTAQDFVAELDRTPILKELALCKHLVVRFGLAGAIHYYRHGKEMADSESVLYYDARHVEGEYRDKDKGHISGLTAMLAATVARSVADGLAKKQGLQIDFEKAVSRGVRHGLLNCRTLFCHGFGESHEDVYKLEENDEWNYEFPFPRQLDDLTIRESVDGRSDASQNPGANGLSIEKQVIPYDSFRWVILRAPFAVELGKIASEIVQFGIERKVPHFPTAKFGNYWVVDRDEIESFRSIRNLLRDHRDKRPKVPLSIAVFGPPGSGKSYGVSEIAKSMGEEKDVWFETYNLAQFVNPDELTQALIPIRDVVLDGKLPIVFFDEFDANLGDTKLGWLKYFLPVMQDGQFKHGERMLKIGGAVFVFAGGTSSTYQKFLRQDKSDEEKNDFRDRKGPDFVSRLRGYVNIRGANPEEGNDDKVFVIRRAIFLRSILQKNFVSLFRDGNRDGKAQIDGDVLHALLHVPKYEHGSRSMQAVLDMSRLVDARQFSASLLPSVDQLNMHVDGKRFMDLLKEASRIDGKDSPDGARSASSTSTIVQFGGS